MFISLLSKEFGKNPSQELLASELKPCYFLHGDEPFLGRQFVSELKELLLSPDSRDFNLDRFWMDEAGWADVIDAARTAPSVFSPWRLTVAEFLTRSEDRFKDRDEDKLSEVEEKLLNDYFQKPISLPGTVMVILYPSRTWKYKQSPVFNYFFRFFSKPKRKAETSGKAAEPRVQVVDLEMKSFKEKDLPAWLDRRLEERKLALTPEARARFVQVVGNDLQRLSSEMDKLQAFATEKGAAGAAVKVEDIDRVCAWTREMEAWSLSDALKTADWPKCVEVLDKLFKEGEEALKILNDIVRFFQEVQLVKAWLQDKSKDRRAIFSQLRPNLSKYKKEGNWYEQRLREFFQPVDALSRPELRRFLGELNRIDAAFKSSDVSPRLLLEAFLFDYCRRMREAPLRRTVRG